MTVTVVSDTELIQDLKTDIMMLDAALCKAMAYAIRLRTGALTPEDEAAAYLKLLCMARDARVYAGLQAMTPTTNAGQGAG